MKGLILIAALLGASCASNRSGDLTADSLASVVILPPVNQVFDEGAEYEYYSTLVEPLTEAGYYVFAPTLVASLMLANGYPTPADMHAAPLEELDAIFGADAALYVSLERWDSYPYLLQEKVFVQASARLVNVETGTEVWSGSKRETQVTGSGVLTVAGVLTMNPVVAVPLAAGLSNAPVLVDPSGRALPVAHEVDERLFLGRRGGIPEGALWGAQPGSIPQSPTAVGAADQGEEL